MIYTIKGALIPTSNMDYVEMVAVWYDSSGAVIDQNPLSWNANNLISDKCTKLMGCLTFMIKAHLQKSFYISLIVHLVVEIIQVHSTNIQ